MRLKYTIKKKKRLMCNIFGETYETIQVLCPMVKTRHMAKTSKELVISII